jgi:hypothetical protein
MTDKGLNLRAGPAAFSDVDRVVAVNLEQFDPLDSRDDAIKLMVETGISYTRLLRLCSCPVVKALFRLRSFPGARHRRTTRSTKDSYGRH